MTARERRLLRRTAQLLRRMSDLPPQNPADIFRLSVSARCMGGGEAKAIACLIDAATDEACGGIDGAESALATAYGRMDAYASESNTGPRGKPLGT